MSGSNPEETGAGSDSPPSIPIRPEDTGWGTPHQHPGEDAQPRYNHPEPGWRPPQDQQPAPPVSETHQTSSDYSSQGRSDHGQPQHPYASQAYPAQPYPNPNPPYPGQPYPNQPYPGQANASPYSSSFAPQPYGGAWAQSPRSDCAHWGRRVGAFIIDFAPSYIGLIFMYVWYFQFIFQLVGAAQTQSFPRIDLANPILIIGIVIVFLGYAYIIWNRYLLDGRRGQSLGKRMFKIKLISEATGEPTGALNAFLRDLLHTLDGMAYVGYLWPLWDDKRQTFADKLMHTLVVNASPTPIASGSSHTDPGEPRSSNPH